VRKNFRGFLFWQTLKEPEQPSFSAARQQTTHPGEPRTQRNQPESLSKTWLSQGALAASNSAFADACLDDLISIVAA